MGFFDRLKAIVGAKANQGLDAVEDPKQMLDYSLTQMEENLRATSRSAVEVGTAKQKLVAQRSLRQVEAEKYEQQARQALALGQEELAREAMSRKVQVEKHLTDLDGQIAGMEEHLNAIAQSQAELKYKIEEFRLKKEELKAVYDASKAQLSVKEIMTSVGKNAENIGGIIDRAEGRIAEMQARVQAIDDLTERGVLTDSFSGGADDLDRRLAQLGGQASVEAELARLKAEMAKEE